MRYCPRCGKHTLSFGGSGGCGGLGRRIGCPNCDLVYEQTNGGIVSPMGGPQFKVDERSTYYGERYRIVEQSLRECTYGENKGKWFWREESGWDYHYHDTEEEAQAALGAHLIKLEAEMPYPDCPSCAAKTRPLFRRSDKFRCAGCNVVVPCEISTP